MVLSLVLPYVALADTLNVNDVVTNGNVTKERGATGTATIFLMTQDETDPVNGCNATGSAPARVRLSASNSGVTIASPDYVDLTGCGSGSAQTIGYTVSSTASGTITISGTASGGKSGSTYTSDSFTVTVSAPADSTAPTSSASATVPGAIEGSTAAYTGGTWTNKDVTVTLSANETVQATYYKLNDGAYQTYSAPFAVSAEGTTTISYYSVDSANNTESPAKTFVVRIDKTRPVIELNSTANNCSLAGNNGWCRGTQTAGFKASDALSGLSTGEAAGVYSNFTQETTTNGASVNIASGSNVYDNAGNQAQSINAGPFKIDSVAPSITDRGEVAQDGQPNAAGWYNVAAKNEFRASDATSGLSTGEAAGVNRDFQVSSGTAEGTAVKINSGNVSDAAGNTASGIDSAAFKIDLTRPTITASADRAPNNDGWYNADVGVSFNCGDILSGIAEGACPASVTVSENTAAAGQDVSGSVSDIAGNSRTSNTVNVKLDENAPTTTATPSQAANDAGWTKGSNLTVSLGSTDTGNSRVKTTYYRFGTSGAFTSYSAAISIAEGTHTLQYYSVDFAGNEEATKSLTVKYDNTAPGIALKSRTPSNAAGWNNIDVTVEWDCTDNGSGPVAAVVSDTLRSEGSNLTANGSCADLAGNTTSASVTGIKIDKTAPTLNCGSANTDWHASDQSVNCRPTDGGSGLADEVNDANFNLSTNVAEGSETDSAQTGSRDVYDVAGNKETAGPFTFKVDRKAPTLSNLGVVAGTAGQNGWYISAVTNRFQASDGGSGFVLPPGKSYNIDVASGSSEGSAVSLASGAVSDAVGNSNPGIAVSVKIDLSDPTNIQFNGPADGDSYYFGDVPAADTTCTANDAVSKLASCVVSGYGTTVGSHTLTATATDNAGRTATVTRKYTVDAWTLKGFYSPVDMGTSTTTVWNTVKNGSTVPLKFEVFKGTTELTDTAVVSALAKQITCGTGSVDDIEVLATGSTSLRYDTTSGQFIYNWKTPSIANNCYSVTMTTQDGSKITAHFKLK